MIRLDVWLTLPSGESNMAGALIVSDPYPVRGGLQGQFGYAPEYLEHPQAFPLDPLHLSFSMETVDADRPREGVHGVFEDSLPDDWGRRLMIRRHKLSRNEQRVPNFGIKRRQRAMEVITEIHGAVSKWPTVFSKCDVPEKDAVSVGNDIGRRLKITET